MQTEPQDEFELTRALAEEIERVLDAHDRDATQIVGILLDVQDLIERQYIPEKVAFFIAEKLPIKVSIIYDCLTPVCRSVPAPNTRCRYVGRSSAG